MVLYDKQISRSTVRYSNMKLYLVWALTDSPYRNITLSGDIIPETQHANVFNLLYNRYVSLDEVKQKVESNPSLLDDSRYQNIINNNIDSRKIMMDTLLKFVNNVVNDYDNGVRIPDNVFKQLDDGTVRNYDFAAYETDAKYQNLFAFKISEEKIQKSEAIFNMTVSKEALNKTVMIGNLTEFLITVNNTGNINLKDVFVTEDKFDGLEYVSYKDSTNKWSFDGNNKWSYSGSLEIGQTASFAVVFKAMKIGNLTNYISGGSSNIENKTSNDTVEIKNITLLKDELDNQTNITENTTENTTVEEIENSTEDFNETIGEIVDDNVTDSIISDVDNTTKTSVAKTNGNATGNPLLILLMALSLIGCTRFRKK